MKIAGKKAQNKYNNCCLTYYRVTFLLISCQISTYSRWSCPWCPVQERQECQKVAISQCDQAGTMVLHEKIKVLIVNFSQLLPLAFHTLSYFHDTFLLHFFHVIFSSLLILFSVFLLFFPSSYVYFNSVFCLSIAQSLEQQAAHDHHVYAILHIYVT